MTISGIPESLSIYTPPESVNSPPLTPPLTELKPSARVLRIVNLLRRCQRHQVTESQPWLAFQLESGECDAVRQVVEADDALRAYMADKIRYDYISSVHRFILRMPSKVHEAFNARVVEEIQLQLGTIGRGLGPSAEFARKIEHDGSERLVFSLPKIGEEGVETSQHEPDAVFEHIDAQFPGVVLEVSFTQKRKDLARLADSYILGSEGNIRAVVGLDIEYKTSKRDLCKRATISVWQPKYDTNEKGVVELIADQSVKDLEFRNKDGNPNTDPYSGLRLQLQDFATEAIVEHHGDLRDEIFISSKRLFDFLVSSEAKAAKKKHGSGLAKPLQPGVRKRRRDETPPEQLDTDDEVRFQAEEQRASKRVDQHDPTYRVRSTSSAKRTEIGDQ